MDKKMNNDNTDYLSNESGTLSRLFKLPQHGTTVRTELIAGMTTFLTMVYIVFVNPQILGAAQMDPKVVFVTTCLIAGQQFIYFFRTRSAPETLRHPHT